MKKILLVVLLLITTLSLTACNNNDDETEENLIYVTVYPMQFLTEHIAGETVTVKRVPGSTVHSSSYSWSIKEQIEMIDSDILFFVSGGVDNYIENNIHVFEDGNTQLVNMSNHIEYNTVCFSHDHSDDEDHEDEVIETCDQGALNEDPHFWLDPVRMLEAAAFVKDKLIVTYPDNQELYNNNYTTLEASLQKLNIDFQEMADVASKPIITSVMLFTYWHERYDIEIIPIITDAHSTETDPGNILDLLDSVVYHGIEYVLYEKYVNSPAADTVYEELLKIDPDGRKMELHALGNITQDEADNGSNYITIMYENLEVLNEVTK